MGRTWAFFLAVILVVVASGSGCSCGPGSGETADAGASDSATPELESSVAESAAPDAAEAAAACNHHLPAGFTQVEASQAIVATLTGAASYRSQSMALDENDDPMFAYVSTNADGSTSLYFVRWDPCAGAFTDPLLVASLPVFGDSEVALAYDPTTKTVGIVFVRPVVMGANDTIAEIWLATMQAPATTFTLEALSNGQYEDGGAGSPSIAMKNGQIAVGLWAGPFSQGPCGSAMVHASCYIAYLLTSTTAPGGPIESDSVPSPVFDGGYTGITYSGADDGGTTGGPYYFDYQPVPIVAAVVGDEGWVFPVTAAGAISVAIDSSGVAGIVAENAVDDTTDNNTEIVYWLAGTESAVIVGAPYMGQDDEVSLVYEGTKPRVLARMSNASPADNLTFFASDDGVTWGTGVAMPTNGATQFSGTSSSLAFDGAGSWGAISDLGGSNGGAAACGDAPLIYTSSDDGAVWSMCGADPLDVHFTAGSPSAAYGMSRIPGTLAASFVSQATDNFPDGAPPDSAGLYYWQSP